MDIDMDAALGETPQQGTASQSWHLNLGEGHARPDSDFDLVVVFDDDAPNSNADYEEVYAPLRGLNIGCDVIPCRWSDFQEVLADSSNSWQDTWGAACRLYERPA